MKREPLLEEVRIMLEAAIFHIEENSTEDAHELIRDALANVYESIKQIQGAREDAARMVGRVPVCTELYDMLAPE
jgi:cell fate regulator YaaT (PSP1 superfamily)